MEEGRRRQVHLLRNGNKPAIRLTWRCPAHCAGHFLCWRCPNYLNRFRYRLPILFALQHFHANHCGISRLSGLGAPPCPSPRSSSPTAPKSPSACSAPPTSWASRRWRSGPRRTNIRCTASRPTRAIRSAAGRISTKRPRADRELSVDRRGASASPSCPAPTPSIRATACCRKAPNSPRPARQTGIIFIGPTPETMRQLGNKVAARNLAIEVGVPVVPATEPLPDDIGDGQEDGGRDRLPGDAQGVLGRRRPRHARHPRPRPTWRAR